ncbi:MAG: hypothetical protein MRY79_06760 [Alphaproteobacteria bacterium]|nr:hypothetical protein [Alphaproteobacteria bacterium]
MAKWSVEINEQYVTKEDLPEIFNALGCTDGMHNALTPSFATNSYFAHVEGPDDMDQKKPYPDGVISINPQP